MSMVMLVYMYSYYTQQFSTIKAEKFRHLGLWQKKLKAQDSEKAECV